MSNLHKSKQIRRALIAVPQNIRKFSKLLKLDKELEWYAITFFQIKNNEFPHIFYSYEIFSLAFLYYTYRCFDQTMDLNMFKEKLWKANFYNFRPVKRAFYHICKILGSPGPINHYDLQVQIINGIGKRLYADHSDRLESIKNKIKQYYETNPTNRLSNSQLQQIIFDELIEVDSKMTVTHAGTLIYWGRNEILKIS